MIPRRLTLGTVAAPDTDVVAKPTTRPLSVNLTVSPATALAPEVSVADRLVVPPKVPLAFDNASDVDWMELVTSKIAELEALPSSARIVWFPTDALEGIVTEPLGGPPEKVPTVTPSNVTVIVPLKPLNLTSVADPADPDAGSKVMVLSVKLLVTVPDLSPVAVTEYCATKLDGSWKVSVIAPVSSATMSVFV